MQTGDKVHIILTAGEDRGKLVPATVVYIHPQRRFYVAEHIVEAGRPIREAFLLLQEQNRKDGIDEVHV